eukprot:CAMPEP_0202853054 /NCGR_PEP_ID=MMETSP1389-20130828/90284_1 /ASSEMBLY_ACC=CAM_ASM_000865 /TAXON_ID=302021 /ORGANISM="Rhodomonas sp., Strain CCMP768" /LENGTH=327 /DNA_ID=CAMNT_0049531593 /DNA_START=424 /DNA_END=1407 /DNA_ORIENTATION=+
MVTACPVEDGHQALGRQVLLRLRGADRERVEVWPRRAALQSKRRAPLEAQRRDALEKHVWKSDVQRCNPNDVHRWKPSDATRSKNTLCTVGNMSCAELSNALAAVDGVAASFPNTSSQHSSSAQTVSSLPSLSPKLSSHWGGDVTLTGLPHDGVVAWLAATLETSFRWITSESMSAADRGAQVLKNLRERARHRRDLVHLRPHRGQKLEVGWILGVPPASAPVAVEALVLRIPPLTPTLLLAALPPLAGVAETDSHEAVLLQRLVELDEGDASSAVVARGGRETDRQGVEDGVLPRPSHGGRGRRDSADLGGDGLREEVCKQTAVLG